MKRYKAPIGSQSGQAVVEYILLLIVVTLIAGGAVYKFSTAFKSFASSYFGNYLACLLESGELPALGQDGSSAKGSGGTCNDSFKAFTLADGRPAEGNGGGSGTSGDGAAGGSGKGSNNGSSGSGGGSGDSTKVGGLNGSFGRANGRPVSAVETAAGKDESAPGDAGVGGGARGLVKAPSIASSKKTEVQLTGGGSASEDDKDDGQHAAKKVAETAENRLRKKKELLAPPRKPAALSDDDKDEGFTFSGFLRWLLIGAMILALVVFLGQQALSISKSQE